ncbi:MAG: lipocalin family protein [Pseudomonadota bacterium]
MPSIAKSIANVLLCLVPVLFTSCLSMSLPKSAKVEPPPATASTQPSTEKTGTDKGLADTWELLHQVDNRGEQQRPRDSTRTLIEFTAKGQVIFNRLDKDTSSQLKSRTGTYTLDGEMINIVDDVGNAAKWPYELTGDSLMIVMPELEKKFYWRRFR